MFKKNFPPTARVRKRNTAECATKHGSIRAVKLTVIRPTACNESANDFHISQYGCHHRRNLYFLSKIQHGLTCWYRLLHRLSRKLQAI